VTVRALLGPREIDALQELATVGCGAAVSALSRLSGRRMHMDVPETWAGGEPGAIADFLGALGQDLLAVGVKLSELLEGHLLLVLPERDAEQLAAALGWPVVPGGGAWGTLSESAMLESGNIVGSAFVSAVARLLGRKLLLSVPALARGGGKACVDALVPREAGRLALATRFVCEEPALEGLILVMPEPARVPGLLAALPLGV
jgi:chemotaxis protein CheC